MNIVKNIKIAAFGLIEVMIAALILTISLLGVASLQSKALYTVVESDRQETAYQTISQLASFATAATKDTVAYLAYLPYSDISTSSYITNCYANLMTNTEELFYRTTIAEWNKMLSTALPSGKLCTCLTNFDVNNTTTAQTADLLIAVNWKTLSGLYSTIATTIKVPEAIINQATVITCPTPIKTTPSLTSTPIQVCNNNV